VHASHDGSLKITRPRGFAQKQVTSLAAKTPREAGLPQEAQRETFETNA
jgi:hypothetical protein